MDHFVYLAKTKYFCDKSVSMIFKVPSKLSTGRKTFITNFSSVLKLLEGNFKVTNIQMLR